MCIRDSPTGFLEANVFGVISPKTKTSIVIKTVANALPKFSSFVILTNKTVASDAIKILTKLLATKIPPIVSSKSSFAFLILLVLFVSSSWCTFSLGTKVIAVSEPDNNAEKNKQIAMSV